MLLPLRSLYESQGGPPAVTGTAAVQAVATAAAEAKLAFSATAAEIAVGVGTAAAELGFLGTVSADGVAIENAEGTVEVLIAGSVAAETVAAISGAGAQAFTATLSAEAIAAFLGSAELDQYGEMVAIAFGLIEGSGNVANPIAYVSGKQGHDGMSGGRGRRRPIDHAEAIVVAGRHLGVFLALNE